MPERQKCSHRETYDNRVIDLEVRVSKEPLGISLVIFCHPVNQAYKGQGKHQSQDQIAEDFPDGMFFSDCVCGDDLMADGTVVALGEPVILGGDFFDEAIFVDELEAALAGTGRINEGIIVLIFLLQANPALLYGGFCFWIVWHKINIDETSISF